MIDYLLMTITPGMFVNDNNHTVVANDNNYVVIANDHYHSSSC